MTAAQAFAGAKLILTCGDDLLVCLRDDVDHIPWPAHWDLPGGGAEPGETPTDCALRELHEEFGLRFPPTGWKRPSPFPIRAGPGVFRSSSPGGSRGRKSPPSALATKASAGG